MTCTPLPDDPTGKTSAIVIDLTNPLATLRRIAESPAYFIRTEIDAELVELDASDRVGTPYPVKRSQKAVELLFLMVERVQDTAYESVPLPHIDLMAPPRVSLHALKDWCSQAEGVEPVSTPAIVRHAFASIFQRLIDNRRRAQAESKPRRKDTAKWSAHAATLVSEHPEWTNRRIAAEVSIDPSRLSRNPLFKRAAAIARQHGADVPRGSVHRDGEGLRSVDGRDDSDPSDGVAPD
jgi:hypothetical protein